MKNLRTIPREGWVAIFGIVALVLCLLLTARETSKDASAVCADNLKMASSAPTPQDEGGTLRIVEVWPKTVKLSARLCLVVAGVAPKSGETRLKQNLLDRSSEASAARNLYQRAIEEASKANKLAADAETEAATAEQSQAANAKDLRSNA